MFLNLVQFRCQTAERLLSIADDGQDFLCVSGLFSKIQTEAIGLWQNLQKSEVASIEEGDVEVILCRLLETFQNVEAGKHGGGDHILFF